MSTTKDQNQVLIVEDSSDELDMLAAMLEESGYQVLQASSGQIALQLAERANPDIILLDIQMPEMDGFETCQLLKANEALKDIPVIFISGLNETLDKVKAFQIGGVDYITKPYHKDELLARVHTHLRLKKLNERLENEVQERTQALALANQHLKQEITERKQAEIALRESEQFLQNIFDSFQDGISVLDTDLTVIRTNHWMEMMYADQAPLLDQKCYQVYQQRQSQCPWCPTHKTLETGEPHTEIVPYPSKVDPQGWIELSTFAVKDEQGRVVNIIEYVRDISERIQAQQLEETVYQIAQASSVADDLEELFSEIHIIIRNVMSAENFYIALYDQDTNLLSFPFCVDEMDPTPAPKPPNKGLTEYVLRTGEPLLCDQATHDQLEQRGEIELVGSPSPIWLGVPLKVERQVIGVMAVQDYHNEGAYTHRELRMLEYVSSQVAEAIARKRTSDDLNRTRTLLQAAIEHSPAGILIADAPDGRIRIVNQAALGIRGTTNVQLNDIPIDLHPTNWQCYYPDLQPYEPEDLPLSRAVLFGETVENVEVIIGDPDREHRWVLANAAPIFDDEGNISAGIVVFPDITELKKAENALQTSESRYRAIVEDQTELITRWLPDGTRTFVNEAYCRYFGQSAEALIGKRFFDFITEDDREMIIHKLNELQPENNVVTYEERVNLPNGQTNWLRWTDRGIFDKHGQLEEIQSVGRDITENKLAQEQIQRQIERLAALRAIDNAIATSFDLHITLDVLLKQAISQLAVDSAAILLLDSSTQIFDRMIQRGFRDQANFQNTSIRFQETLAGQVALERRTIHIPDLNQTNNLLNSSYWKDQDFVTYFGVPLIIKGRVKGVLEIFQRTYLSPETDWLEFLEALAGQAAIAIDNAELFNGLERSNLELTLAYNTTLEGWAKALELRDFETKGHSQRVTDLTVKLARMLGASDEKLAHMYRGALLHDIGKMGIPDHILLKNGSLNDEEWRIMQKHPIYAYEMLSAIEFLRPAMDIPLYHHEKWDGTGYPYGIEKDEIPLPARIFAIIDVWDAMRSDRPYRAALAKPVALEYIQDQVGKHFEPRVAQAFLEIIQ